MRFHNRRAVMFGLAGGAAGLVAACQAAPTPAAKPAAEQAPGLSKLYMMVDTVHGHPNLPPKDTRLCQLTNRFERNAGIVFRARVFDPKTGELMDKNALKGVEVALSNGQTAEAEYGPHPKDPPNEFYWTAAWRVPKDHPTGTLKYSVTATAVDGRIGKFEPFGVVSSLPTILEEVLTDIPAKA